MRRFAGYIMNTFIITFIFLIRRGMYYSNISFFFFRFRFDTYRFAMDIQFLLRFRGKKERRFDGKDYIDPTLVASIS